MPPANNPISRSDTEATQQLLRELSITLQESDPNRFNDDIHVVKDTLDRTAANLHDTQQLLTNYKEFYRKFHPLQEQLQSSNNDTNTLTNTINNLSQNIQTLLEDSADIAHYQQ